MKLKDLGNLVKQKYQQYVQHPAEELGRRVIEKYPQYQQKVEDFGDKINQQAATQMEAINRYGATASLGATMSSGDVVGDIQQALKKRGLTGQVMSGALSRRRRQKPSFQIAQKMSRGEQLTDKEKKIMQSEGLSKVAGAVLDLAPGLQSVSDEGLEALTKQADELKPLAQQGDTQALKKWRKLQNEIEDIQARQGARQSIQHSMSSNDIAKATDDELLDEWQSIKNQMGNLSPKNDEFKQLLSKRQDVGQEYIKRTGVTPLDAMKGSKITGAKLEKDLGEKAIKKWGEAGDPKLGAYLTREGKMVDGSGRVEADPSDWQYMTDRIIDHREIAQDFSDKDQGAGMIDFMNRSGLVRMNVGDNQANFNLIRQPTDNQINKMVEMAENKNIYFDLTRPDGSDYKSGGPIEISELKSLLKNDVLYGLGLIFGISLLSQKAKEKS